jgi:hypothetical protein
MQQKEDLIHQSDQAVLNSRMWIKKLTMILISVSIATVIGTGSFLLGETHKQPHTNTRQKVYTNVEYGFSVAMPEGWSYKTSEEKSPEAVLVVELRNSDNKIAIPLFIEEKTWELVNQEVRRNFLRETIEETVRWSPNFGQIAKIGSCS